MAENDVTINEPLDGNIEPPVEPLVGELSEPESLTGTLDGELLRGYSAYEIAIQNGFVGTEEEWLETLIGAKGDKGDKGDQGIQGVQGIKGDKGDKGDTGDKGDQGIQGIQGIQGEKGEKGDKGDQGDRGPTGYGIGIRTVVQNSNYTITFIFDDGRVYTTPSEVRGLPGEDGKSVTVTQTKENGVTTVVFRDAETMNPIATSVINDGEKGDKGDPGEKGETGDTGPQGIQGIQGEKGDTGAAGQDGYTPVRGVDYWTASDKAEIETDLERSSVVTGKLDAPSVAGTSGQVLTSDGEGGQSWETPPECTVTDVQVNGTSVLDNGVANVPVAASNVLGVTRYASASEIKTGTTTTRTIIPAHQHTATFYGLAKAAGDSTQSASENAVGTYTDDAKTAIRSMLGAVGDTDYASDSKLGVIKVAGYGLRMNPTATASGNGVIWVYKADEAGVKAGMHQYNAIVPYNQHMAAFYGLAKAAGDSTQSASENAVGNYTDSAKTSIRNMLSAANADDISFTDTASGTEFAIKARFEQNGLMNQNNNWRMFAYPINDEYYESVTIHTGMQSRESITIPMVVFYKKLTSEITAANWNTLTTSDVAGTGVIYPTGSAQEVTEIVNIPEGTKSCFVCIGVDYYNNDMTPTVTCNGKGNKVTDVKVNGTSVLSNGVANVPTASGSQYGVVKGNNTYGLTFWTVNNESILGVQPSSDSNIKNGDSGYRPIVAGTQHKSAFYGLAKAAGDTTQASSDNAVGSYTAAAKSAIQQMLGVDGVQNVDVSGATVTITGVANTRYLCGEVTSISITPPASGVIDVVFTSGSTVAVLTLPNTVKMPEWWTGTLETNTIYEINIMDGIYGAVMAWAA